MSHEVVSKRKRLLSGEGLHYYEILEIEKGLLNIMINEMTKIECF